ncbi:HPr family phosphocarrier protein [Lachnospiraceae bacterium HCP1S3_C3]|nr:HPr family phosphocarrier protein [Lachnospiraceae bacterium]MDD6857009.1 HPr family phosphocarrier protein [Lachnospiraceae bacterium]
MVSKKVKINEEAGLHLRPAGKLCNEAIKYKSKITMKSNNVNANAKSVISVLSACVRCGNEIEFVCEGEDEEEALAAMIDVIQELL